MKIWIKSYCKQYNAGILIFDDEIELKLTLGRWPLLLIIGVLALSAYWITQFWLGPQVVGLTVAKEVLTQTVVTSGKLELLQPINIISQHNGKVTAVNVKQGQYVKAGQTLYTLENKDDRGSIQKARAAIAQAEARFKKISESTHAGSEQSLRSANVAVDKAKKQYARYTELTAKGLVSYEQSSDAIRNLAIAQSQLASAQFLAKASRAKGSEYVLAEIALSKARAFEKNLREKSGIRSIVAEQAGILIASHISAGSRVTTGKKLMVLSPTGKVNLALQLDAQIKSELKPGQQVWLAAEGHIDQRFSAEISAANGQGLVEVAFTSKQPADFLQQDKLVSVEIELNRRADTLSLSMSAIRNVDSAEPWVMVSDNGRAQRRVVKLGMRVKSRVEVLEGLRENELVFPATGLEVLEGKRVRLARS